MFCFGEKKWCDFVEWSMVESHFGGTLVTFWRGFDVASGRKMS